MKQIITKDEVGKAIQDLVGQGRRPTLAAVHAALNNRGSMSTVVRLKAEIEAAAHPATESSEGLKAFQVVWALAVGEGRKQQDAVVVELREAVQALTTENERLEGLAMGEQSRAVGLEQAKSRVEAELSQVRTHADQELQEVRAALGEASARAAGALQSLAEVQAAHAAQLAALQSDLASAVRKAHELELRAARADALLEASGARLGTLASRTPKSVKRT